MTLGTIRRRATAPGDRRGFTLVSVLVAVVLLTVGLMALTSTQVAIVKSQANEAWRTSALQVARSYMEEVRARDPWALTSEAATAVDARGVPAAGGPLRRSLEISEQAANLLRVRVRVATNRDVAPVEIVTFVYKGAH